MRVVIAPDKFKGSLPADQVARALADGLREAGSFDMDLAPMADGGDGTVLAALRAGHCLLRRRVAGPDGAGVDASLAVHDGTAIVELAAASGLDLLAGTDRRPLEASSRGTGELIGHALDAGCTRIVLGLGGSACTDGGAGIIAALGAHLLDAHSAELPDGGGALADLARIDLSGLDARLRHTDIVLALDVDNPLLGDRGAARTFGPQKGADPVQVEALEGGLATFARVLGTALGRDLGPMTRVPGAGAAGGVGFAAMTVLHATPRPGPELVAELVGLPARLRGAHLVITGEGSLDQQSLAGKTPIGVARIARRVGAPTVVAVCGVTSLSPTETTAAGFDAVWSLADLEPDAARSMAHAPALLRRVGAQISRWATARVD